jgi:hypothetical protein
LLLFVATTVVGALLAPHPRGPQPSALGDFSVPTAEEGRAIPVVFGTCMIKGGNTVWWGDLLSKAIKVGGGILSFGRTQTTGYKYFIGCQFMLCHLVDALVDVQADGKSIPRSTTTKLNGNGAENYIEITATGDKLFGGTGPGGGGGISGIINFYRGISTQQPDTYLGNKQGRVITDQSGIGYTFVGIGNGGMTSLSAGSSSLEETFTITFNSIDGNVAHSTFGKAKFDIVGSVSGTITNSVANAEGSHALWADQAFSSPQINLTIVTGSTQYQSGDTFTVKTLHSHVAPAYRGLCYAVFKQLYVGTSSYLKPLAFVVRRCPDPLSQGAGVANVSGDANPVLAVYDLLTNVDYGLGIPSARIDPTSFSAAASTCATEGLGISMQFDTQASADQLIGEVLRHCDGVLYTDPQTGLWSITLARGGYNPATLPTLTVDSILQTPDFSRGSWRETTNLVNIRYASRAANFDDRSIRAYDPANISLTGEVRPQTIDFKGISSETTAALVAMRVLKTLTYPLSKIKIVANRTAWSFRPGGLFKLTWVPLGIVNQVFRITRIGYGELVDGKISIDAVEDIFGINSVAFVSPPVSGWVNPVGAPQANSNEQLVEMPYHIQSAENLGSGIFAMAMAVRNLLTAANFFQIWRDSGSGYADTGTIGNFCPLGFLSAIYPAATPALDATGFTLTTAGIDLSLLAAVTAADVPNGKNLLLIDQEIMSWQTPTQNADGTFTISGIQRGVMDTVPVDHAAGAKVWFFSEGVALANPGPAPLTDLTINVKMLPTNGSGTLPVSSATARSVTTASRGSRPYPPGNLVMQALAYGTRYAAITGGPLVLVWKSRNRLTQTAGGTLVKQDAGDITPEASTTYDVKVADANGVQIHSDTGVAVETWTYTMAQRVADGPTNPDPITVKVFANVGGSLESFMPNSLVVSMTGFGMDFGRYFGGVNA